MEACMHDAEWPLHAQVGRNSDVIFIAVKPNYVTVVLEEMRAAGVLTDKHTIVSIAAGVTLDS
jgi:pyrroline-5-carboxylate reductase